MGVCDLNHRLAVFGSIGLGRKEILQLVTVDKEARIRAIVVVPFGCDRRFSGRG